MRYFLGVDVGGTKTHALVADESGQALGFATGGCGNWEGVGYDGLTRVLVDVTTRALKAANLSVGQLAGAGMGIGGFDWPSQREAHLEAIRPLGLNCPLEIVNDAALGILAGSLEGWGVSLVAGTGCNARGLSRDHQREGRAIGGWSEWSGEYAGGYDIAARAMRAVTFEWLKRGPATALTQVFLEKTGARDPGDLVEGLYLRRYEFDPSIVLAVFETARQGDEQALDVMRWAGQELAQIAIGVIRQLELQDEAFEVILIGSLHGGHPLLDETLKENILKAAPRARLMRLAAPPVVGAVLLGMEQAGQERDPAREKLIRTTNELMIKNAVGLQNTPAVK
jgi:N-acetylglucosamine kinase-like BadF-type ATPase